MSELERWNQTTPEEFARLGISEIAYVKRILVDDEPAYAVHAADGTRMAVLGDWETAAAALLQHDLAAVRVH
jgi:hypothetical protein